MALKLSVAGLKWANFSKMLVKTFKLFLIFNLVKVDCFETENWLNNVKSLKTKCVQSFKDENFAKQNEEILKFASCEESWAKWSYKYKVRKVSKLYSIFALQHFYTNDNPAIVF